MNTVDITVEKYNQTGIAVFFPALSGVSLEVEEYLRTDYINKNDQGLLSGIKEKEFTTFGDIGQGAPLPDVLGIHLSNNAIASFGVVLRILLDHLYKGTLENMEMPRWAQDYALVPYIKLHQLNPTEPPSRSEVIAYPSERNLAEQANAITSAVLKLGSFAGVDAFAIARRGKVLRVIILTDPIIAGRIKSQVPANPYIGAVAASHHQDLRGRVYLTYALFDSETGEVDPSASFGNILYTPSRLRKIPANEVIPSLSKGEASISTIYTKVIATLPILIGLFF